MSLKPRSSIKLLATYPVSAVEQLTAVEPQRCLPRELLGEGQTSLKTQTGLFAKCCRKWRTGCGTGYRIRPFRPPLVLRWSGPRSWTDWARGRPLGSWPWSWTWTPTTCLAWVPAGLATNSIFFLFPFCEKSLICLEDKSMTPHRGNTILFSSSTNSLLYPARSEPRGVY